MLFAKKERTLEGGAPYGMVPFTYLDLSSRVEAERVRQLLDRMLEVYPEAKRNGLANRLRSDEVDVHHSAFLELSLFSLFSRNGFSVVDLEPDIPGTERRPDFLVQAPSGQRFYVEAVLATGMSDNELRGIKFREQVRRTLDEIVHKDFLLGLHESRAPGRQVKTTEIRRQVERWLHGLSKADVQAAIVAKSPAGYMLSLSAGDTSVQVSAFPRSMPASRRPRRGVGVISHAVRFAESPAEAIRAKVKKKASRYGNLDLPYYIAVDATNDLVQEEDFEDALFGTLMYVASAKGTGYVDRLVRARDGVFLGPNGPVATRVTGTLCFNRLEPWRVAQCSTRVIENPWAQQTLGLEGLSLPIARVSAGRLTTQNGSTLWDLLGLWPSWPED